MSQESDILYEFEENFQYAKNYWAPQIEVSRQYTRASAGFTWSDKEKKELREQGREPLEFNIMRRAMQFYSGYLRDNLNTVIATSMEGSDPKTADQITKMQDWVWDKGKGYSHFIDAADEAGKSGMALCGIEMDYDRDFVNGDAVFYKRTNNSFYLDPLFEQIDLKDCGFAITRDLISRSTAKRLLSYIDKDVERDIPLGFRDNKFVNFHPQFSNWNQKRDVVAYDQYYRRTSRTKKYLVDMDTGFARDLTDKSKEEIDKVHRTIKRFDELRELSEDDQEIPNLEVVTRESDFIELNVFLNGVHFYQGIDKTGIDDTYPFVPILCYFEPSLWDPVERVQGFPSALYSNQRQFNKRHMKIVDMMDSEIATGFKYLLGSVPDPSEMLQSGQNKLIGIDPEAPEGLNSVQQLQGGQANPSLIEYQRILDEMSLTLLNVNESVLGIDQDSKSIISGKLAQVRIAQGLRTNRKYFDNIEISQKVLAGLVYKVIQKYPPAKVARIINEEPTEQFNSQEFEDYDMVLKQSIRSQTQRDAFYNELVNLKREGIVDVPGSYLIKKLDITGISELEELIQSQEEQQKQQQEKLDLQERIGLELVNSQKEENIALSQERRTRAVANLALETERVSEAEENRAQAALAKAKTITEIDKMNDDRLMQVLQFVNQLERDEIADREAVKAGVEGKAQQIKQEVEKEELELKSEVQAESADDVGSEPDQTPLI